MKNKTRSLLQELQALSTNRDINHVIESRGHNVITSAINLLEMIRKHRGEDEADLLERKLLNAIRARDQSKFSRVVRKQNESQEKQ